MNIQVNRTERQLACIPVVLRPSEVLYSVIVTERHAKNEELYTKPVVGNDGRAGDKERNGPHWG